MKRLLLLFTLCSLSLGAELQSETKKLLLDDKGKLLAVIEPNGEIEFIGDAKEAFRALWKVYVDSCGCITNLWGSRTVPFGENTKK